MPVLDTTFLVDAKRDPRLLSKLAHPDFEAEAAVVPANAALEFAFGADDPAAAVRELSEAFVLRPLDGDVVREAARLARAAYARGRFPGWSDIQIAGTASHDGMCVLTRNVRHFRDALDVATWDYANEPDPPR